MMSSGTTSWLNLSGRKRVFAITCLAVITGVAFLIYKHQPDTDVILHRSIARRENSFEHVGHLENSQEDHDARSPRCHAGGENGNIKACDATRRRDVYPSENNDTTQKVNVNVRGLYLQSKKNSGKTLSSVLKTYGLKRYLPNYFLLGKQNGRKADYQRGHVVFVHNTKAGGSTIKGILKTIRKQKHIPFVLMAFNNWIFGDEKYMSLGRAKNRTIFAGTKTYRVCEVTDRPCSYFTMLREPVQRVISSFLFCKQEDSGCSVSSVNVTLKAWALGYGIRMFFDILLEPFRSHLSLPPLEAGLFQQRSEGFQNFAQTMKSKYPTIVSGGEISYRLDDVQRQTLLDYCLRNLENWFSVIGLTEEFELSLQLYEEVYALPFTEIYTVPHNRGKIMSSMDESQTDKMKAELRSDPFIMEALYEDLKLYEKAKEIMVRQKRAFQKY